MAFVVCVLQVYNAPCYILSDFLCLGRLEIWLVDGLCPLFIQKKKKEIWLVGQCIVNSVQDF
jgi:hypothetical protein